MATAQRQNNPASEQQHADHSPIEEEFAGNQADTPAPRDGITIAGYSIAVVLIAIFAFFFLGAAILVFVT